MAFQPLTVSKELFSGGVAGTFGVFWGVPLDFIKVRCQAMPEKFKGMMDCGRQTYRAEGFRGFFRGASSPLFAQFFVNALAFAGESMAMRFLEPDHDKDGSHAPALINSCIAGGFGGFLQCFATVPTDLVKVKMQVDQARDKPKYRSTWDCVQRIFRANGPTGFLKGYTVTVVREIPSFAMYFMVYDTVGAYLSPRDAPTPIHVTMFAGGMAGCSSWAFVYPMDVVKTYIQLSERGSQTGIVHMASTLYKKHGVAIFFRGIGPVLLRAFPVNAATFLCYEHMKKVTGLTPAHDSVPMPVLADGR
jgi:hypothetical protein